MALLPCLQEAASGERSVVSESTQHSTFRDHMAVVHEYAMLGAGQVKRRREEVLSAIDTLVGMYEGEQRTRDTILKREREKQSKLTRLEEQLQTVRESRDYASSILVDSGTKLGDLIAERDSLKEQLEALEATLQTIAYGERPDDLETWHSGYSWRIKLARRTLAAIASNPASEPEGELAVVRRERDRLEAALEFYTGGPAKSRDDQEEAEFFAVYETPEDRLT